MGQAAEPVDTDGDGVSDESELEQGTDPSHNGIIDFPEPMVFDMVRGIGAEQGEVEANVLVLLPTSPFAVEWAPEIEAAVVDWFAIELEAGLIDSDFELIKLGLQGTVALDDERSVGHGLQSLLEYRPDEDVLEASLLYILGVRLAPGWSVVSLIGPVIESELGESTEPGALINATLFWAPHPRWVIGSEQNVSVFADHYLLRWMPQAHVQLGNRFQLQAGAGLLSLDREPSFEAAFRVIAEL